jgi:outer membrane putative beta-barrel porin/alpha-amylase
MKTRMSLTGPALCALALSLATQSGAGADSTPWSLGVGFDYSSGTYGESQSTDILYIPVIGKYEIEDWAFKLTVPYISVRGPGNVIPGLGEVNRTPTTVTTQSGLGDIVAAATYTLYAGDASAPGWDLTGKIKFGTADANKGLGTGENDYSAQVDVYKSFDRTTVFGTLGYSILGSSATIPLNNVFYAAVGASYKFSDQLSSGLSLYGRQAASSTSGQQGDLTAFATYKLDPLWKVQGYALLGLASGSPDWAIGAVVSRSF